jgi:hypothetical protein
MPFLALLVPAGKPTRSERWMLDADMLVGESVTSFPHRAGLDRTSTVQVPVINLGTIQCSLQ